MADQPIPKTIREAWGLTLNNPQTPEVFKCEQVAGVLRFAFYFGAMAVLTVLLKGGGNIPALLNELDEELARIRKEKS